MLLAEGYIRRICIVLNKKVITMKDIAREADVSVATVLHVINQTNNVSEKTPPLDR